MNPIPVERSVAVTLNALLVNTALILVDAHPVVDKKTLMVVRPT